MRQLFHVTAIVEVSRLHELSVFLSRVKAVGVQISAVVEPQLALPAPTNGGEPEHHIRGFAARQKIHNDLVLMFGTDEFLRRKGLKEKMIAVGRSPNALSTFTANALALRFIKKVKPGVYAAGPKLNREPISE